MGRFLFQVDSQISKSLNRMHFSPENTPEKRPQENSFPNSTHDATNFHLQQLFMHFRLVSTPMTQNHIR